MDNLLMLFDEESQKRYKTVLENIKNASDSFYDSYNSLVENFVRNITIHKVKGSITNILKDKMNKDFLLNDIKLDEKTYNKILDIALKLNSHKHKKQKNISLDTVVKYMRIFYDLVYAYAKYVKYTIPSFNEDYFINLYDCFEQDKKDVDDIKEELKIITKHINKKEERDDYLRFKSRVFHCGNYSYESYLSNKEFIKRKVFVLTLFTISLIFFIIGASTATEYVKDLSLSLTLPGIYYIYRYIQFILCGKQVKCDSSGKNSFVYTQLTDDYIPLSLGMAKAYHVFIAIVVGVFIISGFSNIWFIFLFVGLILTTFFFLRLKKTYVITVMHSEYGDYYYSTKDENIVHKNQDGGFSV